MSRKNNDNIDEIMKNLIERTKGKYITQGVSFNKDCPRQMSLLRESLLASVSFSGLAKETLALRFSKEKNGFYIPQKHIQINENETLDIIHEFDESIVFQNVQNWI